MISLRTSTILLLVLTYTGCTQIQKEQAVRRDIPADTTENAIAQKMDLDYSPTFEKAHPEAKLLMNDEFFFDVTEETAPFGSDDGADTYAAFRDWRIIHKSESPVRFLRHQLQRWGYPPFDLRETSFEKLVPYLDKHYLGDRYLTGTDAAIAAIAFGQLYLEGTIDADFKEMARISLKRELDPKMIKGWGKYANTRQENLNKLVKALDKVE